MSLTAIFMANIPPEWREQFIALPADEVLAQLVIAGREAWPTLELSDADFVAFLARSVRASAIGPELRAADLWLVCAYARGLQRTQTR